MKRDLDLIIQLLEFLETREEHGILKVAPIEGYDDGTIRYHQALLADAGFVTSEKIVSKTTPDRVIEAYPFDLTWRGHEFLASIRQEQVWEQLKQQFGRNLREAPIETLFQVAKSVGVAVAERRIRNALGLEGAPGD